MVKANVPLFFIRTMYDRVSSMQGGTNECASITLKPRTLGILHVVFLGKASIAGGSFNINTVFFGAY